MQSILRTSKEITTICNNLLTILLSALGFIALKENMIGSGLGLD